MKCLNLCDNMFTYVNEFLFQFFSMFNSHYLVTCLMGCYSEGLGCYMIMNLFSEA